MSRTIQFEMTDEEACLIMGCIARSRPSLAKDPEYVASGYDERLVALMKRIMPLLGDGDAD